MKKENSIHQDHIHPHHHIKRMEENHYHVLGYVLTLVSYMTLTIALPLIPALATHLHCSIQTIQYGVSLLFLTFSLSAILLSALAEFYGIRTILSIAQLLSIISLCFLCFSTNKTMFVIGCIGAGCGTGCYASNARAMISRHALSFTVIKQAFSIISILVIVAPMLSSYLAMAMNHFHWRLAFAMMAIIEVFTLIYAMRILKHEDTSYRYTTISALLLGFVDCIKQKYYFLNMLIVGIGLSIFMQIFMGNIHALLIHQSTFLLSVTIFVMNFAYIAGILFFRHGPHFFAENKIRAFLLALFFFITLIFSWSSYLFLSLGSIFCICFIVGFLVPLSTTNGMSVIKKNHGAASGLFTFSFACISSLFAGVQAQTGIPPHLFMSLGLWICLLAMIMICVHLRKNDSCKPS